MKNILQLILILACCTVLGQHQPVSAGGNAISIDGSFSYSIGQIAQSYATGSIGSVAEGLQQPFEISTLGNDDFPNIILEMSVYPNPTTNYITLKISDLSSENLAFMLYDVAGKQIANEKIINSETQINLENFNAAIYFLEVKNQSKTIKNFKIIKN